MSKAPICDCGQQMVERRNKSTGQTFFGCAKFGRGGCGRTASTADEDYGDSRNEDAEE